MVCTIGNRDLHDSSLPSRLSGVGGYRETNTMLYVAELHVAQVDSGGIASLAIRVVVQDDKFVFLLQSLPCPLQSIQRTATRWRETNPGPKYRSGTRTMRTLLY